MRMIDADALKKKLFVFDMEFHDGHHQKYYVYKEKDVDDAPTIDAVEVVRCKDCEYYDIEIPSRCIKDRCYCATVDSFMKTTDYCSYAERRSDE